MREELYRKIKYRLEALCANAEDEYFCVDDGVETEPDDRVIKHIDLWNHNDAFLEQEAPWPRPAVFIEFVPFKWHAIVPGVEYRAQPLINLHVVTDWAEQKDIGEFRLLDKIHEQLAGLEGGSFMEFDIYSSATNHNHEDIVENIETYTCVGFRHLK